MRNKFIVL